MPVGGLDNHNHNGTGDDATLPKLTHRSRNAGTRMPSTGRHVIHAEGNDNANGGTHVTVTPTRKSRTTAPNANDARSRQRHATQAGSQHAKPAARKEPSPSCKGKGKQKGQGKGHNGKRIAIVIIIVLVLAIAGGAWYLTHNGDGNKTVGVGTTTVNAEGKDVQSNDLHSLVPFSEKDHTDKFGNVTVENRLAIADDSNSAVTVATKIKASKPGWSGVIILFDASGKELARGLINAPQTMGKSVALMQYIGVDVSKVKYWKCYATEQTDDSVDGGNANVSGDTQFGGNAENDNGGTDDSSSANDNATGNNANGNAQDGNAD